MKKTSHPGFELWTPEYEASILSLDHQSRYQRFPHINISSIQNYLKDSFLPVTFTGLADLFPQLGSSHGQLCGDAMYLALVVQCQNTSVAGAQGSNLGCEF
jgi:hypothetical protein